jgi:hypothetical protein
LKGQERKTFQLNGRFFISKNLLKIMSTNKECEYYDKDCGFVKFRKKAGSTIEDNPYAIPLPENGDCGIEYEKCLRVLAEKFPHLNAVGNPIRMDEESPSSSTELSVGLKK